MMKQKLVVILSIFIILWLSYYCLFIEPENIKITNYTIKDNELSGLKVVFASDFHIRPQQEKQLEKVVNLINSQDADIVLSAGDFVNGHTKKSTMPISDIAKELGKVKTKHGFFATLGNHDGWYGSEIIAKELKANGIKVLENENEIVKINGKEIYIAGVEDMMTGDANVYLAIEKAESPIILLTHTPDMFSKISDEVNLTLAGHTHGGQIHIPGLGSLIRTPWYDRKYARGRIVENGSTLLVTTGLGSAYAEARLFTPPEIIYITLKTLRKK
jgi:predicted MPP superfamily phosphohydrolase